MVVMVVCSPGSFRIPAELSAKRARPEPGREGRKPSQSLQIEDGDKAQDKCNILCGCCLLVYMCFRLVLYLYRYRAHFIVATSKGTMSASPVKP